MMIMEKRVSRMAVLREDQVSEGYSTSSGVVVASPLVLVRERPN